MSRQQQRRRWVPGLLLLFALGLFGLSPAAGPAPVRPSAAGVLPASGGAVVAAVAERHAAARLAERHGTARLADQRRSWPSDGVLAVCGGASRLAPHSYAVIRVSASVRVRAGGGCRVRAPPAV